MTNKTTFLDYMKKAWYDTMMPLENEEKRKNSQFVNYFLGWPGTPGTKKIVLGDIISFFDLLIYFVFLKFVLPFYNILRRPPELVFNLLAETFSYLNNLMQDSGYRAVKFLSFIPTLAQGLFKACYFAFRLFTSPFVSSTAISKIIDDNIEQSSLKSVLINVNRGIHYLVLFTELLAGFLLGKFLFGPLSLILIPVVGSLVDSINAPAMNFSWEKKKPDVVSPKSSESNDYALCDEVKDEPGYELGYEHGDEPGHYAPLFSESKNDPVIDDTVQHDEQPENYAQMGSGL